ncbi:FunK1 protein kinase [Xylaria bambusicola]|uniref:FunK1 protein kinase n=1 Tax=Xylaria bambusicola TaxID=326684 RepID=UPI0020076F84|nr:FunK1 protein kinase [Xylaria bambusicola]KAI0523825.1 FunK1 protein kinase [Xylaria bambusicola]
MQAFSAVVEDLDNEEILDNMNGYMHGPMDGFIKKYFGNFPYVHRDGILEIQTSDSGTSRCRVPSAAPLPDDFLRWFAEYVSSELDGARGSWHISGGNTATEHKDVEDGARLLLSIPPSPIPIVEAKWDHVQVVSQFYHRRHVCYRDGLLQLCRSAFQVFAAQPTRLFLHGFYIRGSLIELWAFDRSGLYCSEVFHVQKDFIQFLSVILSYQRMTDGELGKSDIIQTDEGGNYITLDSNGVTVPSLRKLYLDNPPIASRGGLVGNGTACYRTRKRGSSRWDYVVKFKWRWARKRPEDELLRRAKEKCVWGAISLDYYKELESTADLRSRLRWGTSKKFSETPFPPERHDSIEKQDAEDDVDGLARYTEDEGVSFMNRILTCVVTSPVGRPLHTFQSPSELLRVFHDAIKCHRSLYLDAGILHQDVSAGNLIILDDEDDTKPKGILIDLDSAIELADREETGSNIVGTRLFLAIGVMNTEHHTYRHDLESFLYLFLWTIITNRSERLPETSRLRRWSDGDWNELAMHKSLDMEQDGFERILEEFPLDFSPLKPLARDLRRILFPLRDGVLWTGTDDSPEATVGLYDEIMQAFEEAIGSLRWCQ